MAEQDGVVYLDIAEAVPPGDDATRLGWKLLDVCEQLATRDDLPVAVVLRCQSGPFCRSAPSAADDGDALESIWPRVTEALAQVEAPTVACIAGDAVGPAWELALACDLRVAAAEAHVGSPEVSWGRLPAAGGTQRLVRLVGPALALRLLLLSEVLPAPAAFELGLLHRIVPADQLDSCLEELLARLRTAAPIALAYAKETVRAGVELPLADGLRLEADLATLLHTTRDRTEGLGAFLARRAARFEAR